MRSLRKIMISHTKLFFLWLMVFLSNNRQLKPVTSFLTLLFCFLKSAIFADTSNDKMKITNLKKKCYIFSIFPVSNCSSDFKFCSGNWNQSIEISQNFILSAVFEQTNILKVAFLELFMLVLGEIRGLIKKR